MRKVKENEIRMKWTVKDFFEFLRPSWKRVIFTTLLSLVLFLIWWAVILPGSGIVPEGDFDVLGQKLVLGLLISILIGLLVIVYTIISLITYLASGRWRG